MRLILEEQQKYLQSFINNATYHPMNTNADVTYQTVNLFWQMFHLLYFWLFTLHLMKFHYIIVMVIVRICAILVKIDILNTYRAMICSYFGIVFLLLFKKIENTIYTSFKNNILLFINGLIFGIMKIQNNQSLEFEWVPMLAPFIRSVSDWRFPWLHNVFVKSFQDWLNSVQQCQGNFTKDAGQKMFISISWQTYEGLKTSVNY